MIYRRGDVVLLELPFSDRTGKKKRPGLVIANETYLSATSDVIVCAITSQTQRALAFPGATEVRRWKEAGLLAPSVVKATIHTVDRALIDKRLGGLDSQDLSRVDESLMTVLF
jgi:mRNA interferase MazF